MISFFKLGDHYFLYDAGQWQNTQCLDAVKDVVKGKTIELMVLSHSDGDHIGNADKILQEFDVKKIIWTGSERPDSETWKRMDAAINEESKTGSTVINLKTNPIYPGTELNLGKAVLTFVYGMHEWTATNLEQSEQRNAISNIMKLTFHGESILFAGDTVGRRRDDPDSACKDAEKDMVDNNAKVSLKSDVLIAPHHGANNASSTCFIEAVNPKYVIFSAGHVPKYQHPTSAAAERYLKAGVKVENIFRTDLGDDEPVPTNKPHEWKHGSISGCKDQPGDDDIEILLAADKPPVVRYRDDGGYGSCGK
jgi:beta-lactamase superfamily II metal-dependent hydrolase